MNNVRLDQAQKSRVVRCSTGFNEYRVSLPFNVCVCVCGLVVYISKCICFYTYEKEPESEYSRV